MADNWPELRKVPGLEKDVDRLKTIVFLESPFDLIEEAKRIAGKILPHNNRIVEEKTDRHRQTVMTKADRFIGRMKQILDYQTVDQDLRNRSLYALRAMGKKIQSASSINSINRILEEMEDAFDVFVEEVENGAP